MPIDKNTLTEILPLGHTCTVCGNRGRHNPGCAVGPKDQTIADLEAALKSMLAISVHPLYSAAEAGKAIEGRLRMEIDVLGVKKNVPVISEAPKTERELAREFLVCPYCNGARRRSAAAPWYGSNCQDKDVVWLQCTHTGCGKYGCITSKTWELAQ